MDISANQIEAIVRQVVASMGTGATASKAAGPLPKVAKVAMLVGPKKIEIQEVPLPELGEDDILDRAKPLRKILAQIHRIVDEPLRPGDRLQLKAKRLSDAITPDKPPSRNFFTLRHNNKD